MSDERDESDSMPSRKDSSERDMFESCDAFDSRLSDAARCLSSTGRA